MPHHNETIANLSQLFSSQVYKRFVEMGRVCLVQYGPEAGKLGVVIDIMNSDRVLLDGVHHNRAVLSAYGPKSILGFPVPVPEACTLPLLEVICVGNKLGRHENPVTYVVVPQLEANQCGTFSQSLR